MLITFRRKLKSINFHIACKMKLKNNSLNDIKLSHAGNRTRAAAVKAPNPNH